MTLTNDEKDKLFNSKLRVSMTEIEKTKAEIKVLEAKLSLLEEMENHKTPCEIAYKRWWGEYPGTETWTVYDETRWVGFQKGYNTSYEETVSKFQPTPLEKLKANNWYVDPKTLLKYNWESTQVSAFKYNQRTYIRHEAMGLFAWLIVDKADPIEDVNTLKILENEMNKQKEEYPYKKYTPEETEKSLKNAMETAKENGVFDEPEPETLTLKQLLKKWEIDFAANWAKNRTSELYDEEVERFIQMFTEWMPNSNKDYGDGNWEHGWNTGYNAYHNTLMRKLK